MHQPLNTSAHLHSPGDTILVVDDMNFLLKAIKVSLEKHGYKVLIAANGLDALSLYTEHADEIELVLTDIRMPGMDGIALTRALKMFYPQVKIIVSSANATEPNHAELRALGVETILTKPYGLNVLLASVQDAIRCSHNPAFVRHQTGQVQEIWA